jgi:cephalosporin-C deacetylase-like acetyl esterase
MTKITFPLFLFFNLFASFLFGQKLEITKNWTFAKGDNMDYKNENFNDSNWQKITIGKIWEDELNDPTYDGFGWYRWKAVISSKYKKEAEKYGGFMLQLGKIDDADQTFFNGEPIGANGKFPPENESAWDIPRKYIIPLGKIKWDAVNTIAVRVHDSGGGGGMYGGEYELEPLSWKDKVEIEVVYPFENSEITENQGFKVKLKFKNDASENIKGKIYCDVKTFTGFRVKGATQNMTLKGLKSNELSLDFEGLEKGFYQLFFTFISEKGYQLRFKKGLAVSPTLMTSKPTLPADFDEFWKKTRTELDAIAPTFKVTAQEDWSNSKSQTYLIEMQSFDNVTISGWYVVPKNKTKLPGLLKVQGYSTVMMPDTTVADMAVFSLNIRGHGNSRTDVNPGFPGFLQSGLESKEKYIYRGAYMDCVRAIDFLFSRPEVNQEMIVVEGGSQGGALSFATAALDNRVKFCFPDVPFLSDFPNYFNLAEWPSNEFKAYQKNTGRSWNDIYQVLNYFDIKNFATKITCPVYMSVGLFDDVCPPHINFATYNNLFSVKEKSYTLYPNSAHSLPIFHYKQKTAVIRKKIAE